MNAIDVTGNTSGMTLSDDVQIVNGISGNALYLPELSYAFLNIGKTLSQFSISFWRKWDSITDSSYNRYVFYLSSDFYMYFDSSDNYLVLKMPGKDQIKTTVLDNINNNHFCITYKQSDKINVLINAVSVYNVTAENQTVDFSAPFYFGKIDAKAHSTFDEIRFYSKVISDTEVAGLYRMVAKGYSSKSMQSVVATTAPKYLGIGILAGLSISRFTGATVSSSGTITIGDTVIPNVGDFMVNYSTVNASLGVYVWSGSLWSTTTDVSKLSSCAVDLINLNVGGITVDQYTVYTAAIIKSLFAQEIALLSGGSIHDVGYSEGKSGFKINSNGKVEFNNITARGVLTNGKYFNFQGQRVNGKENGIYIGDGQARYTKLVPIMGENENLNWRIISVQATYTSETFTTNYIRAMNLGNGMFAVSLTANTIGIYTYTFGSITKTATATLPNSITTPATFDIFCISGERSSGWKIGVIDNNVLRIYMLYYGGSISLLYTITFPVNVRNIINLDGIESYDYTFAVETYNGSSSGDIYIYGYTSSTGTLTQIATASSPSKGYPTAVMQNQRLQYNGILVDGVTQILLSVLVGKHIVTINLTTKETTLQSCYLSEVIGNNVSETGRCSAGSNIFDISVGNLKMHTSIWRNIPDVVQSQEMNLWSGILSYQAGGSAHRLIQLDYGLIACIGAGFGGIKVITLDQNL